MAIIFWSIGVILSTDTISYVLLKLVLQETVSQLKSYQDLYASFITIIILAVIFGVVSHNRKTALREISLGYFISFLIICVVNAFILALVEKKLMNIHGEFTWLYVMLVLSSLVQMAFVLVLASSNNWHRKNEELKEQYLELQVGHYQYLEERNYETKKFRHDLKTHIYVLRQYINESHWDELNDYLDTICGKIENIPGYISVHNETVDAILNYYNNQFLKKECSFKVIGSLPQQCHVSAFDLCTIFSNILSNALENASLEDGQVELSIHFDNDMIYIRERNTFQGNLKRKDQEIITTKAEKDLHGFGIHNIKDSVEKYFGSVNIEIINNEFVIDIIMENKNPNGEGRKKSGRN